MSADLVAPIAARQYGLITRQQALDAGVSRSVIAVELRRGNWIEVRRGVYRSAFALQSWRQRALGACIGSPAVLSHASAAYVHGLITETPQLIEVLVDHNASTDGLGRTAQVHRSRSLRAASTVVDGLPVTIVPRTIADLAASLAPGPLAEVVDRAFRACHERSRLLADLELAGVSGACGGPAIRAALAPWRGGNGRVRRLESVLEAQVMRVFVQSTLPMPVCQHHVELPGRGSAYLDFAWPRERVGLEVDGYAYHADRTSFDHDRARGNALLVLGWSVLHTTATEVRRNPAALVAAVSNVLAGDREGS